MGGSAHCPRHLRTDILGNTGDGIVKAPRKELDER